jgi:hypothetical protein
MNKKFTKNGSTQNKILTKEQYLEAKIELEKINTTWKSSVAKLMKTIDDIRNELLEQLTQNQEARRR